MSQVGATEENEHRTIRPNYYSHWVEVGRQSPLHPQRYDTFNYHNVIRVLEQSPRKSRDVPGDCWTIRVLAKQTPTIFMNYHIVRMSPRPAQRHSGAAR
ncbi:uncharacterized protein STEHIDRAFT_118894 [Stereum hirsutum FP-91666 SS1]|uniref:uncharacterized protein n=1 Tax=Stereum hirsutum (strain FP-91666) TaxID=721885 RepID=UPI000440CC12|nr:uncharacterized protein STEHIDRAFT_118894 [Stereum hirsutum FP-91666 SS1]EIM89789.1 hypothetical protein STEHIDRAFT_118894 [Stereum hirsutum FP-91666 SS1]